MKTYNFIEILENEDKLDEMSDEEIEEIVRVLNSNILKKLDDDRHETLLNKNNNELLNDILKLSGDKIANSLKINSLCDDQVTEVIEKLSEKPEILIEFIQSCNKEEVDKLINKIKRLEGSDWVDILSSGFISTLKGFNQKNRGDSPCKISESLNILLEEIK